MTDGELALATKARRAGLLTALHRVSSALTLARLDLLLRSRHGEDLAEITIEQLSEAVPTISRGVEC